MISHNHPCCHPVHVSLASSPVVIVITILSSILPNTKHEEKIRSGDLTPAFLGALKGAELLPNPCILVGPQRQAGREKKKWLPHPYLLGGPEEGGSAT